MCLGEREGWETGGGYVYVGALRAAASESQNRLIDGAPEEKREASESDHGGGSSKSALYMQELLSLVRL